jgi:hypothetical protein
MTGASLPLRLRSSTCATVMRSGPEGDRRRGQVEAPRPGLALARELHRLGEASLQAAQPLEEGALVVRAEGLHVEHLESGALRGGDDQVQRRQVAVGEDLMTDEAAVRPLQPGDGSAPVAVLGDGVVEEQPTRHQMMRERADSTGPDCPTDVLHHAHRGHRLPPLVGRELAG